MDGLQETLKETWHFYKRTLTLVVKGSKAYYAWCLFLLAVIAVGFRFYLKQHDVGLIGTNMTNEVSWGLYIANFTYLVGMAAAAVLLVVPAYVYHFKPIKEIVVLGELFAASSIVMAILFVMVDLGRLDRFWHMIPLIGSMNFPQSLLAWDVLVLNGYFFLNLFIPVYLLVKFYYRKDPNWKFILPFILLSVPWAVGIHTVTAFLYNGLAARPFWNASILAPRFLASAFCSGTCHHHHYFSDHPEGFRSQIGRRGPLQDRRTDRLCHVSQSLPSRLRIIQGILFPYGSHWNRLNTCSRASMATTSLCPGSGRRWQ